MFTAKFKLFILPFAAVCACADTTLSGRVLDPSGAPVSGAAVTVYARDYLAQQTGSTNADGAFRFAGLPKGDYLVEARAAGFARSASTSVSLNAATSIDLKLEIEAITNRILVTAAGNAQSTDEISKALDVVDAAQLDRRAAYSLIGALSLTPGMRVEQLGGPGSFIRVQMRGLRAFDTSVLIDGFRLRDGSAPQADATGFLGDLLVIDTDRIEVLRGSGASLYGTHATGGVINIVTDTGGGPFHGSILAEGGGLGLMRGVMKVGGGFAHNRVSYTLGGAHLNVLGGVDGDDRTRNSSAQGALAIRATPRTLITGRLFTNNVFLQLNSAPVAAAKLPAEPLVPAIPNVTYTPAANDPDYRRSSYMVSGLATIQQQVTNTFSVRAGYQGLITSRDNRDGPGGTSYQPQFNNANLFDSRIDTLQTRADLRLGRANLLSGGYEFERETFNNLSTDPQTNARLAINERSGSLYFQEQTRLLQDRLQISFSGRTQWFDLSLPQFFGGRPLYTNVAIQPPPHSYTGDVSASYFIPKQGTKLRAHSGNGYRAPSLYERFGASFYFGSFSAYGDPRLRPERSIAFDFGFDQYLANSKLRLSGTYFYTRLQEVIGFDSGGIVNPSTDPYGRFGGYRNTGGGLARGVELSAEAAPLRALRVQSSYTYTNAQDKVSGIIGGSLRSPRIFTHMFTLLATRSFGKRVEATFDFLAASDALLPMYAGAGNRGFLFPGPRKGNLALSYTHPLGERKSLRVYTRVENIFNQTYYEEGFLTPKAWAVLGLKFQF
jgi:vitamin B12 transporter